MSQSSISASDRPDDVAETVDKVEETVADAVETAKDEAEQAADATDPQTDHSEEHHDEDRGGSTFAGMALRFLILVIVVFGLSLWLVPMIAPHVPASVAKHIMPGQQELDMRLAAMDDKIAAQQGVAPADLEKMQLEIAELTKRLAAAEEASAAANAALAQAGSRTEDGSASADALNAAQSAAADAADVAKSATAAATEANQTAIAASEGVAAAGRRISEVESQLDALNASLSALNEALATTPGEGSTPELAAAFSALQARVDGLSDRLAAGSVLTATEAERFVTHSDLRSTRSTLETDLKTQIERLPDPAEIVTVKDFDSLRAAIDGKITDLSTRIATTEKGANDAATSAAAAAEASETAIADVRAAIRTASLRAATAAMASQLQNGLPFAGALTEIQELTETPAPDALSAVAETGVATTAALLASFGPAAQSAIAADIRAEAGDGLLDQTWAQTRSLVAGRPKSEQDGDSTSAILSRVEAKLQSGSASDAFAEAGTLSDSAKAALGEWLVTLGSRVAADSAAENYIAAAFGQQG